MSLVEPQVPMILTGSLIIIIWRIPCSEDVSQDSPARPRHIARIDITINTCPVLIVGSGVPVIVKIELPSEDQTHVIIIEYVCVGELTQVITRNQREVCISCRCAIVISGMRSGTPH